MYNKNKCLPGQNGWLGHKESPPLCQLLHCPGLCAPYRPPGRSGATAAERSALGSDYNPPHSGLQHIHTQVKDSVNISYTHLFYTSSQSVQVILTSKLIEMIPNVVGLVIVPSILVVNELYIAWRENQCCLDRDTGSRHNMIMMCFSLLITQNVKAFISYCNILPVWLVLLAS